MHWEPAWVAPGAGLGPVASAAEAGSALVAAAGTAVRTGRIDHLRCRVSGGGLVGVGGREARRTIVLTVPSLLVALAILVGARLLAAVLGVITLLVVLLLILLRVASELARLESLSGRLEGGGGGVRAETSLVALALVHVELLLRLARQVFVLRGGIILPGVEVRHGARAGTDENKASVI